MNFLPKKNEKTPTVVWCTHRLSKKKVSKKHLTAIYFTCMYSVMHSTDKMCKHLKQTLRMFFNMTNNKIYIDK